jgi:ectoine hydroxylase-related dioxygenase (phytanoyl-CoA dioxygenase family)
MTINQKQRIAPPRNNWADFDPSDYAARFADDGLFVCDNVFSAEETEAMRGVIAAVPGGDEVRRKRSVYGVRNLLEICPAVRALAADARVRRFVTPILGDGAFAVRAIFFDKAADANWSLFWHQDNVIAVKERGEAAGFVGWSQKAGVWQVQPPAEVLAGMVAVRVHLDDCGAEAGPLRVLPGSHRVGWIEDIDEWKARVPEVVCTAPCGAVVVMRPLLLHASARSESTGRRRVIHVEFAASELPGGLEWNNRVGV